MDLDPALNELLHKAIQTIKPFTYLVAVTRSTKKTVTNNFTIETKNTNILHTYVRTERTVRFSFKGPFRHQYSYQMLNLCAIDNLWKMGFSEAGT